MMNDRRNLHCTNRNCPVHQAYNSTISSIYDSDDFRMYSFKVVLCQKNYSHDWTSCPFTHRGERARRRDPRLYLPFPCPFFKEEDTCMSGDSCKFAHGIFEYYLHPGKYRTTVCTNGISCDRKICFFAHTKEERRDEMTLSSDDIYFAFASNVHLPVAVAPRHVLKASGSPRSSDFNDIWATNSPAANTSTYSASAYTGINFNADTSAYTGINFGTAGTSKYTAGEGSSSLFTSDPFAGPSTLRFGSSSPVLSSSDLSSLPFNLSGLYDLLRKIGDGDEAVEAGSSTGRKQDSNLDVDEAVATQWDEYQLWG